MLCPSERTVVFLLGGLVAVLFPAHMQRKQLLIEHRKIRWPFKLFHCATAYTLHHPEHKATEKAKSAHQEICVKYGNTQMGKMVCDAISHKVWMTGYKTSHYKKLHFTYEVNNCSFCLFVADWDELSHAADVMSQRDLRNEAIYKQGQILLTSYNGKGQIYI